MTKPGENSDEISASKYLGVTTYRKSNELILSRSTPALLTNKLLMICTMRAEKKANGELSAEINGNTLKRVFNNKSGSFYKRVKESCYAEGNHGTLLDYRAVIEDDESEKFAAYSLITAAEFSNGTLSVTFNPKMERYITGMKQNYTSLDADEMMSLKSNYSWRLLELFRKEVGVQKWLACRNSKDTEEPYVVTYGITDLKLMLGIIDSSNPKVYKILHSDNPDMNNIEEFDTSSMKDFRNFKRNVIDAARKELFEKSTLRFDYEIIRSGRGGKSTSIRFFLYKNIKESVSKNTQVQDIDDMIDEMRDFITEKIPTKDLRIILQDADYDIKKVKKAYEIAKDSKEIRDITRFMRAAIKRNFEPGIKGGKGSIFCDIPESDYMTEFIRKMEEDGDDDTTIDDN